MILSSIVLVLLTALSGGPSRAPAGPQPNREPGLGATGPGDASSQRPLSGPGTRTGGAGRPGSLSVQPCKVWPRDGRPAEIEAYLEPLRGKRQPRPAALLLATGRIDGPGRSARPGIFLPIHIGGRYRGRKPGLDRGVGAGQLGRPARSSPAGCWTTRFAEADARAYRPAPHRAGRPATGRI